MTIKFEIVGLKLLFLSLLLIAPFVAWSCSRITKSTRFDNHCTYYIQQFENADNEKDAKQNLDTAIHYLEANKLTTGFTSITDYDDNEDIGLWYKKLADSSQQINEASYESYNKLKLLKEKAGGLEQTTRVKVPEGISIYPHNTLYMFWMLIGLTLFVIGLIGLINFFGALL